MEQNKKNKRDLIIDEYDKYSNHVFKYPKAQFCYFYFKGICQLSDCQFAHGVDDFNFDNFLLLIQDKEAFQLEKQSEWQKPYFYRLIPNEKRTFDSLFEYQNSHLSSFNQIYTQQELILDSLKRMDIRREINKEIFTSFSIKLLKHFDQLPKVKFYKLLSDAGYCYSFQPYTKLCLYYSKKTKDKETKKTQEIVRIYPSNNEMMKTFVKALEDYLASPQCKEPHSLFPMSFATLNSIICKHIAPLAPNPFHFIERNGISQKLFCEELVKYILKSNNDALKSITVNRKELNDFYVVVNLNEIIEEIKATFWVKHYNGHNTQLGYVSFDFIEKTFDIIHIKEFCHEMIRTKLLFELYKAKNIICIDNTSGLYIFNYKKFDSNDPSDFIESYYHKRCGLIDKSIIEESLKLFQIKTNEEEDNQSEPNAKGEFNQIAEIKGIIISKTGDIVIVDSATSLQYFINQIINSEIISVDLEGDLTEGKINLIQICDKANEIFVIDIHTFVTSKDTSMKQALAYLHTFLVFIFESNIIKKLFFDGRNDVNALHKQFKICPNNYIDLSSLHSFIKCFSAQIEFESSQMINMSNAEKEFDVLVKQFHALNRKGLNAVLAEYNTDNKTNELKESMHKLMDEAPIDYFLSRPINDEFLLYSALDVKYLKTTYVNMRTVLISQLKTIYKIADVDLNKLDLVMLVLSANHLNYGCRKANSHVD